MTTRTLKAGSFNPANLVPVPNWQEHRHECGSWTHPALYPIFDSNEADTVSVYDLKHLLAESGFYVVVTYAPEDVIDRIHEACDLLGQDFTLNPWIPRGPDDGYFLVDIGQTEDGGLATFVKAI